MQYQQLSLHFHPSKQDGNSLCVRAFDRLSRSYLILTKGLDSMNRALTPPQMVDVFSRAFGLRVPPFARRGPARDASTQCEATPAEGTQATCGAAALPPVSTKPPRSSKSAVPSKAMAFASAAAPTNTTAPEKKPVVLEKVKEEEGAVAALKQADKDAKKAARKANKRRKQKQKQGEKKAATKAPEKEESSSSSSEEDGGTDDEEELDPNSAFVATALSKMSSATGARPKVPSGGVIPKTVSPENLHKRSRTLAHEGCEMCRVGSYKDAIDLFTSAIKLCGTEHSYYGNRSYCFAILGKFDKALKDADMAIELAPHSAKGHFRRGQALLGLQNYTDAAEAFKNVLKIEPDCPEALKELHGVYTYVIKSMGFSQEQAEWALDNGAVDVQTAVNLLCGPNVVAPDVKQNPGNLQGCRSLWVGNLKPDVTEKMLLELFRRYGEVQSIRTLYDRHCAFINYGNTLSPGKAMDALQGMKLCGMPIVIRFPDNRYEEKVRDGHSTLVLKKSSVRASGEGQNAKPPGAEARATPAAGAASAPRPKLSGPVNGNECFFWRTSGCDFGDNCYYEHIPSHRGIDRRPPRFEKKFK